MTALSSDSAPSAPKPAAPAVNGWQADYLDAEYRRYFADPASVGPDLQAFFRGFDLGMNGTGGPGAAAVFASVAPGAAVPAPARSAADDAVIGASRVQSGIDALTTAYRGVGHLAAKIDPLGRPVERPSRLDPSTYGLTDADMSASVLTPVLPGRSTGSVAEVIARLEQIYCGSIGLEFTHISDAAERAWFLERFEQGKGAARLTNEDRAKILDQLIAGDALDKFLGKRYQGKKRFSIEGGEALIPFLKWCTQRAGEIGTQEIILGMAHRGRLSVLKNYLGKDLTRLFTEFEDSWSSGEDEGGGDVKYHRGYSGDQYLPDGRRVHLSMLNNPSHLESVNALVMGRCRAKQDLIGDTERHRVISLLIHGDAALSGQGVVAEGLTLTQLEGYCVGGTLHVVINNLVGFTTDPSDSRSTHYCTDIAKMVNAPVLHVNGDDPEAVVIAAELSADYRHRFKRDIFVDIVCFRRYGHNEQDEPRYTQPMLYASVDKTLAPAESYAKRLVAAGVVTQEHVQAVLDRELAELDAAQTSARNNPVNPVPEPGHGVWAGFIGKYSFESPKTAVDAATIAKICEAMGRTPPGFHVHPKLADSKDKDGKVLKEGLLTQRARLPQTRKICHADAEQIAIGTLTLDGTNVRLSGQDSRRGTFSQRHAVLRDEKTGAKYVPLNNIIPGQKGVFNVWDSPLSEYAVMGFDYGYSRGMPQALVMWEGQFGDFANTAQVIIDQYMAASEAKWSRWAGLVLLLPHGYEGQGPEHSSARLERFLLLCADNNMEVVYPSTAAQTFHVLRRQVLRTIRKPLIVATPKKFLRIETSTVDELSTGQFNCLLDDPAFAADADAKGVKQVLYCSGKIFHELHDRRTANGRRDTAIVRVEQLYPFHTSLAKQIDARYPASAKRAWVQEEPRNAGAFLYAADVFREQLGLSLGYIGRPASASPATGSEHRHKAQQDVLLTAALGPAPNAKPGPHAPTSTNGAATDAKPGPAPTPTPIKSKR